MGIDKNTYIECKVGETVLKFRTGSISLDGNYFVYRNDKGKLTDIKKIEPCVKLVMGG